MKPTKVILTSVGQGGPTEVKQLNPNHTLVPWLPLHSPRSSHVPRRPAANLTGSRAAPPGRRPHQLTRRATELTGSRAALPSPAARPPVLAVRPLVPDARPLQRQRSSSLTTIGSGLVPPPRRRGPAATELPDYRWLSRAGELLPPPTRQIWREIFFRERDLATTLAVGRGCGLHHHEDTTLHHG
jgi:hypothetical protein